MFRPRLKSLESRITPSGTRLEFEVLEGRDNPTICTWANYTNAIQSASNVEMWENGVKPEATGDVVLIPHQTSGFRNDYITNLSYLSISGGWDKWFISLESLIIDEVDVYGGSFSTDHSITFRDGAMDLPQTEFFCSESSAAFYFEGIGGDLVLIGNGEDHWNYDGTLIFQGGNISWESIIWDGAGEGSEIWVRRFDEQTGTSLEVFNSSQDQNTEEFKVTAATMMIDDTRTYTTSAPLEFVDGSVLTVGAGSTLATSSSKDYSIEGATVAAQLYLNDSTLFMNGSAATINTVENGRVAITNGSFLRLEESGIGVNSYKNMIYGHLVVADESHLQFDEFTGGGWLYVGGELTVIDSTVHMTVKLSSLGGGSDTITTNLNINLSNNGGHTSILSVTVLGTTQQLIPTWTLMVTDGAQTTVNGGFTTVSTTTGFGSTGLDGNDDLVLAIVLP